MTPETSPAGRECAFTAVFQTDLCSVPGNPFLTDTPFGRPGTLAVGDVVAREDVVRCMLDDAIALLEVGGDAHEVGSDTWVFLTATAETLRQIDADRLALPAAPHPDAPPPGTGSGFDPSREAEDNETYEIGKRDGREEAIQDVAARLDLDDEYRWSTEPDRHQPGPEEMLANIVEHVESLRQGWKPALAAEAQGAETGTGSVHEDATRRGTLDPAPPPAPEGELEALDRAATQGVWSYRPDRYDDWGFIRGPKPDPELLGSVVAVSRGDGPSTFGDHRQAGTDPFEANGRFICALVNGLRSGALHPSPARLDRETVAQAVAADPLYRIPDEEAGRAIVAEWLTWCAQRPEVGLLDEFARRSLARLIDEAIGLALERALASLTPSAETGEDAR